MMFVFTLFLFSHIFETKDHPRCYVLTVLQNYIWLCYLWLAVIKWWVECLLTCLPSQAPCIKHSQNFPRDLGAMSTQDYPHLLAKHNQNCKESPESLLARAPRNFTRIWCIATRNKVLIRIELTTTRYICITLRWKKP